MKIIILLFLFALNSVAQDRRPNVVFILADDLGLECLSSYGGKSHKTPNLDKFATESMSFTHCFSNPYCTPSRAEILTGRYPFANGMNRVIYNPKIQKEFLDPNKETSFAHLLQKSGYKTCLAGKWQLSFLNKQDTINAFGFDDYLAWQIWDGDNKTSRHFQPFYRNNGKIIADQIKDRFGPDVMCDYMVNFIETNKDRPFLAYYTSLLPHFPWVPTPDSATQDKDDSEYGNPKYFPDMVTYLDKNVGRILSKIKELGLEENTIVIFAADNGTDQKLTNLWGDGVSISGGKGTMTDRGTRIPLMVRWPGKIKAASQCTDLVELSDFLPTICELTGVKVETINPIHGRSFAPQLLGRTGDPRSWVHVQDVNKRHLRSRDWILNNSEKFIPVNEIGQAEKKPVHSIPEKAKPEHEALKKALKELN